ncbi:MAG: thioredoxin family protein [Deltaproteobacteria bacterium]|nr:thioredoxin family protein [Deltaproteobacteria bacterium]
MEIIIIGTDPPCPRCRETHERIRKTVKKIDQTISIRKIIYSSEEGQSFGKLGTAHELAQWGGIDMDWDRIRELASGEWTQELDRLLMPLKERAEKENWIMTPVVVIDGKVQHFGSVPEMDELRSWLIERTEKS